MIILLVLGIVGGFMLSRLLSLREGNSDWLTLTKIGEAIVTTDKSGHVLGMNAIAEHFTGWKASEAIGKPLSDIVKFFDHDTRNPVDSPALNALAAGATSRLPENCMLRRRDNSETPVECVATPIISRGRRAKGAVVIFRDISERYNVQRKLAESEDRLRVVTNEAHIGLVMLDRDRRYLYANSFYMKMIGFSDVFVIGKRVEEVLPLIYERIKPYLDRAFSGERLSYEVQGNYKKELSQNRTYSVTYEPQTRHSLVVSVVIVILDITDIKNNAGAR